MQKVAIPQESLVCKPDILKDIQNRLGNSQLLDEGFSDKVFLLTGLEGVENCVLGAISVKKAFEEFMLIEDMAFDGKVAEELEEIESLLPVGIRAAGLVLYDTKKEIEPMLVLKKLFKLKATNQIKISYSVIFRQETEFKISFISGSSLKEVELTLDTSGDLTKVALKDQHLLVCNFNLPHVYDQGKSHSSFTHEGLFSQAKTILQIPDAEISIFSDHLDQLSQSSIQDKYKSYLKEINRGEDPKKKKGEVKTQVVQLKILFPQLSYKTQLTSLHYSVSLEQKNCYENTYQTAAYISQDKDIKNILQQMLLKLSKSIEFAENAQRSNPLFNMSRIGALIFENELINHGICGRVALDNTERSLKVPLHLRFNLPLSRPFFTESQTVLNRRDEAKGDSDKLKTVHSHITNYKGVDGGEKTLIFGDYVYYHYTQDGYNDKGWGCAYRSLQTVVSWFLEQKYAKAGVAVPSIDEIQKILVEMGDKEPKFLGSKDWIGAFEVNLVLNKLLEIDSKIMHVSNGANIASHTRELAEHFKTEGTPVMIGGGVLAYTLLGVDFNDETGDCNFLILDPHYGGAENPKTIIDKGWCQWKGPKIFLENTFYNFCLPQRPKFI